MKIKMFEKATEIQKAWKPKIGDRVYSKYYEKEFTITAKQRLDYVIYTPNGNANHRFATEGSLTWLPRIEDLIEILKSEYTFEIGMLFDFYNYIQEFIPVSKLAKSKALNLWLSFVMKEKYKKVWNGDDWV